MTDKAALRFARGRTGRHRRGRPPPRRQGLIVAAEGNLSLRLDDGSLLVTPSGRRKDELGPGDLLTIDAVSGRPLDAEGRPTSDLAIHRAVHAARPDIRAVVHAHVPAAIALTLAGHLPDPTALPETALFLSRLPLVRHGELGSEELAERIAAVISDGEPLPGAVLLERHGALAVGRTIDEAVDRIELVDLLCRVWRDALALGFVAGR